MFNRQTATLGVDIGTTGCRSVVYTDEARVVASADRFYPTHSPKPGWAEQDPDEVVTQVEGSIQDAVAQARAMGYDINLISFSAVNHSIIPIRDGRPLRPCIIWADNRSMEMTEQWKAEGLKDEFYEKTCCPLHPMYLPGKLAWLRNHEAETFAQTDHFISFKEFLFLRWFGRYVVDMSIASSSGLLNAHTLDWDKDILTRVGVRPDQLSEIVPTTEVMPRIQANVVQRLGLNPEVKVVIGAGDGVLSSLGAGGIGPGEVTVMIGTSGAARITVSQPTLDPEGRTWCYTLTPDAWVVGGAINNAGLALEWVRQKWLNGIPFEEVERLAASVSRGSDGLIFLPFLTGERSPYWNPNIRGTLLGIDLAHGPAHFARAAMEGVAYRLKSVFEPIEAMAGKGASVRIGGGFMKSPTWVQMMADVLNQNLEVPGEPQGSAFGAVVLAWMAAGKQAKLSDSKRFGHVLRVIRPTPEGVAFYRGKYAEYRKMYEKVNSDHGYD